ncbi:MAG: CYTH domain-containing protein [Lachnospiraceae bacterium]|nr:CYTH domain-containing protein [Lachnospiraceae bacterium]
MEIEKKYLIRHLPEGLEECKKLEIEQGYLNRKPTLRIRKCNDEYIFTYKSVSKDLKKTDILVNEEIEFPLDERSYKNLKKKVDDHIIKKTRYVIPLEGGLKAELDVFHGRLEGLFFVEVEFPDVDAADAFIKPEWFGEDVSADKRYRNGHLAKLDSLKDFT